MSEIQAIRNTLINKVATVTGFTLKKSAKSTGGLSMSNKDMVANGLAHFVQQAKFRHSQLFTG